MEAAFVGGAAVLREGAISHPIVVSTDQGAISAAHSGDGADAGGGLNHSQVGPTAGGVHAEAGLTGGVNGGDGQPWGAGHQSRDRFRGVVAEVEGISEEILAGVVLADDGGVGIDEIVVAGVGTEAVVAHAAGELMEVDRCELGETGNVLEAEAIDIFKGGLVVDEAPLEGGGHQPMGLTGAVGRQITEVDGEGGKNGVVVDGRSDQLETDLEAEFVLDDFGLGGGYGQVVGNAIAAVVGEEAEHIGLGSLLQGACEGIVGEDIALQEVIQGEHGLGQDGDRRRREVKIDTAISAGVGDAATDRIAGGLDRSSGVFGKDGVDGSATGGGGETAGAIERTPEARESG